MYPSLAIDTSLNLDMTRATTKFAIYRVGSGFSDEQLKGAKSVIVPRVQSP